MVFHQSDSTGTLVSLGRTAPGLVKPSSELLDPSSSDQQQQQQQYDDEAYVQTSLLLEIDEHDDFDDDDDNDDEDDYWMESCTMSSAATQQRVPLYLPVAATAAATETTSIPMKIDEYLNRLPYFQQKCDELLGLAPRRFSQQQREQERILYVAQGERASSTSTQADVLVSDRATTCHILAMRSTTAADGNNNNNNTSPMASMAHLDGTQYTNCILNMVREHVAYHHQQQQRLNNNRDNAADQEEKKSDDFDYASSSSDKQKITLEIHVMGGFNDDDGTSSKLSEWLLRLLADLASSQEFAHAVDFVLKTCAVSSMNNTTAAACCGPIGRGLAIDITTGEVYLAKCDTDATGPASVLRSVYLWTSPKHLRVIHTADASSSTSRIIIEPFQFRAFGDIPSFLKLSDELLLKRTSTSPDVEEDDFCDSVRQSLRFLYHVSCQQVFGPNVDQLLIFERRHLQQNKRNEWHLVQ